MALARQCDLCGRTERFEGSTRDDKLDEKYCESCQGKLFLIQAEQYERLRKLFETAQQSVSLYDCLHWVSTNNPQRFRECFGEEAERLLQKVVAELEHLRR